MNFKPLENNNQLSEIKQAKEYTVIFKHNTTCPISKGVYRKLDEGNEGISGVAAVYLLDLHAFRELSNAVATDFDVPHQSPQVLLIKDGKCTYNEWGYDITAEAIADATK